jgi:hypothetical protein
MRAEERKRMVKVLWRKSIGEPRTGGNSEVVSYHHEQGKCGRENDQTPDPIGLTAEFKCR